jgi:hypothetical protein
MVVVLNEAIKLYQMEEGQDLHKVADRDKDKDKAISFSVLDKGKGLQKEKRR